MKLYTISNIHENKNTNKKEMGKTNGNILL